MTLHFRHWDDSDRMAELFPDELWLSSADLAVRVREVMTELERMSKVFALSCDIDDLLVPLQTVAGTLERNEFKLINPTLRVVPDQE